MWGTFAPNTPRTTLRGANQGALKGGGGGGRRCSTRSVGTGPPSPRCNRRSPRAREPRRPLDARHGRRAGVFQRACVRACGGLPVPALTSVATRDGRYLPQRASACVVSYPPPPAHADEERPPRARGCGGARGGEAPGRRIFSDLSFARADTFCNPWLDFSRGGGGEICRSGLATRENISPCAVHHVQYSSRYGCGDLLLRLARHLRRFPSDPERIQRWSVLFFFQ